MLTGVLGLPELRADGADGPTGLTWPWAWAAPGTYFYMAPEMIRHEPYDQKADVYSWGVLLAEVLTQRAPYEGLSLTPVQARPPRPGETQRSPCCCPVRQAAKRLQTCWTALITEAAPLCCMLQRASGCASRRPPPALLSS